MKWQAVIANAIQQKKVIEILYSDGIWRTIEPHTYGLNTAKRAAVSAFRTGKMGHPNEIPTWRLYLYSEIREVRVTEYVFVGPRPGYSPKPKNFSVVISKL